VATHIQLDALGGIAGDMFIASVLDAWPELADDTIAAIRAAGENLGIVDISLADHRDDVFSGRRFANLEPPASELEQHRTLEDIESILRESSLNAESTERAISIFRILAVAESEVHGVAPEEIHFHEVGAKDSIADIVGAAFLIGKLDLRSWSIGPIPTGSGRIETMHGPMPVPAPATARLLRGFRLLDDGIAGERVTPTGAAILSYLRQELGDPLTEFPIAMNLERNGIGFGTRTLPGISNILRTIFYEELSEALISDRIGILQFEIDDQTAEDLAVAIDVLRAEENVLDVLQMPAFGKKGRMVFHLQVLCRSDAVDDVIRLCFLQTTTLGVRWTVSQRATLKRETVVTGDDAEFVSVKIARRPDGTVSAKSEIEDVRDSGNHDQRQERRREAEERALEEHLSKKS
jgi:uncharacterized protein (TIGR00299 family) protein